MFICSLALYTRCHGLYCMYIVLFTHVCCLGVELSRRHSLYLCALGPAVVSLSACDNVSTHTDVTQFVSFPMRVFFVQFSELGARLKVGILYLDVFLLLATGQLRARNTS